MSIFLMEINTQKEENGQLGSCKPHVISKKEELQNHFNHKGGKSCIRRLLGEAAASGM